MVQASNNEASQPRSSLTSTDHKVEIVLEQHEGVERFVIRYSTWTEGLGWCSQKTICLDGDQLDELHRSMTVARRRLNYRRAAAGQPTNELAQVIQLPLRA